jgi:hypothetical protein
MLISIIIILKLIPLNLTLKINFLKNLKNIQPGIYRIEHIPENQYIIIENGDSLWIRVNVEDFKESLTFSGKRIIKKQLFG